MILLMIVIALNWLPPEPITSETPWHEQNIEIIPEEPTLDDIEREWTRRQYRIMEVLE